MIGQTPERPSRRLSSGWREQLVVRLAALQTEIDRMGAGPYKSLALECLARARGAAEQRTSVRAAWTGVDVERAWVSTHAAEVAVVRGSSPAEVTAALPSLLEEVATVLPKDARVPTLKKLLDGHTLLDAAQQRLAADILESSHHRSDAQHVRVRSFRNILFGTTALMTVFAVAVGVVATFAPNAFAVCGIASKTVTAVCPTGGRHPTGGDVFLVELLGLLAAAITGAVAIRKLSGTSTPYEVPLASLAVKLPIGALTAVGGLLLIRAGFGPTITTLDHAQVCAYALVFGAAQQLFMQFVDKRAKTVLDAAAPPGDKSGG